MSVDFYVCPFPTPFFRRIRPDLTSCTLHTTHPDSNQNNPPQPEPRPPSPQLTRALPTQSQTQRTWTHNPHRHGSTTWTHPGSMSPKLPTNPNPLLRDRTPTAAATTSNSKPAWLLRTLHRDRIRSARASSRACLCLRSLRLWSLFWLRPAGIWLSRGGCISIIDGALLLWG